ncbi:MAG: hypothetical protein ACPGXZ_00730 [Saprospiraceae bacterium]
MKWSQIPIEELNISHELFAIIHNEDVEKRLQLIIEDRNAHIYSNPTRSFLLECKIKLSHKKVKLTKTIDFKSEYTEWDLDLFISQLAGLLAFFLNQCGVTDLDLVGFKFIN